MIPTKAGRAFQPVPGPIAAQQQQEKANGISFPSFVTPPRRMTVCAKDFKCAANKKNRTSPEVGKVGADRRGSPKSKGASPSNAMPRRSPPSGLYAGPRFSEPPSPKALPQPPSHWMNCVAQPTVLTEPLPEICVEMTNRLKVLLKVQA